MFDNSLSAADFQFVAKLLRERSALSLDLGKEYLVQARLTPVAQRHDLPSIAQLLKRLRGFNDHALSNEVVEAMVTTETSFFRDFHPFETLRKTVLPQVIQSRQAQRQLNIWCAASSSGQEPYTIAMIIKEHFRELDRWRINLTASDISLAMIERSRAACYSQLEVNRGLPAAMMLKWFTQTGTTWQLADEIRSMVTFTPMNLARPWPTMPKWDLIFLRNVMIYFDSETKETILGRITRLLQPDGYLLLGGAETTLGIDDSYQRVESLKAGYYRLKP